MLDRAVDVFWSNGAGRTTTRVLEAELGMGQSSIYNAFGSKTELLHRSIDRYLERVEAEVLEPLVRRAPSTSAVVEFVRRLVTWISDVDHPGCLMLNVVTEAGSHDAVVLQRATDYRTRLRRALGEALAVDSPSGPNPEVVLAGVLGLNMAAASGADHRELAAMAASLCDYVESA